MPKRNLSADEQKQMAGCMRKMADMMDADMPKQMEEMRKHMNETMKPSTGRSKN